jgi:hypothetical protein
VLLELCHAQTELGPSACGSTALSSGTAGACAWRSLNATSAIDGLVLQLLPSLPGSACLPADLGAVLATYLQMTAPESCYDVPEGSSCPAPRCFYDDHGDHGHCMPDWQFVSSQLSDGAASPAAFAAAAQAVSFTCNPESNWLDSHDTRPSRLNSRDVCTAVGGGATLQREQLAAMAVEARVPGVSGALLASSPPKLAPTSPQPPQPSPALAPSPSQRPSTIDAAQPLLLPPPLASPKPPPPLPSPASSRPRPEAPRPAVSAGRRCLGSAAVTPLRSHPLSV